MILFALSILDYFCKECHKLYFHHFFYSLAVCRKKHIGKRNATGLEGPTVQEDHLRIVPEFVLDLNPQRSSITELTVSFVVPLCSNLLSTASY